MKLTDPITNWSFECLTDSGGKPPAGGLVLQQITHDGHNFAKDIRVIGLWIETEVVDPPGRVVSTAKKFFVLDSTTFTVSAVTTLTPKPVFNPMHGKTFDYLKESDAALDFTEYFKEPGGNYFAYGVSATFDAPGLLNSFPNSEYADLSLEQIFLFSRYANSPKHEPSGGLSAARFHPMLRYKLAKNASYDEKKRFTRVSSIRFDYRLHLYLDRHYDVATNATLAQFGNQAGLFADSDTVIGTAVVAIGSAVWNIFKAKTVATAVSRGSFDAVEKPLALEVTAPGLAMGFPVFTTSTSSGSPVNVRCWDNVHWWGSRGAGAPLISAPGAFHCVHCHWRWGSAAAPAVGSNPRFNPNTWPAGMPVHPPIQGMWGPLVDPGIWIQSLRVAIAKHDPRLDPNRGIPPSALSKDDWKSLFNPGLRSAPLDISRGDDIVLWYSAEVHRAVTVPASSINSIPPSFSVPMSPTYISAASGTVFIHGLFFAHDAEKTGMVVGSTAPAYRPADEASIRSAKSWFRPAS